jgi:hypothetical protein
MKSSKPKTGAKSAAKPDSLTKASNVKSGALDEKDLKKVAGGTLNFGPKSSPTKTD